MEDEKPYRLRSGFALDGSGYTPALMPSDAKECELIWAKEFADAYYALKGVRYDVARSTDEPGDVLLKLAGQKDIYLQLTQAFDQRRLSVNQLREWYTAAIWKAGGASLKSALSGVKITLNDAGQIINLPNPQTPAGRAVVDVIIKMFLDHRQYVYACPMNLNGSWQFTVPGTDVWLRVTVFRFAPAEDGKPGQWLWHGACEGIGDMPLARVLAAANVKFERNYSAIPNPFWLIIYSAYSYYDINQQTDIRKKLEVTKHHFGRIFFFDALRINQVFPYDDSPENTPGQPSWTLLPEDAMPLPNDSRYRDIEYN